MGDVTGLFIRMLVGMTVVIGVMWIAARVLRSRQMPGTSKATTPVPIQVIARQGVGRNGAIAVVRVADTTLLLGITDQQINVLHELDVIELGKVSETDWTPSSGSEGTHFTPSWKGTLDQLRDLTARK